LRGIESYKADIIEFGRRLYERDLIGAAEGNLSARLPDGRVLITPSAANKGRLESGDMIVVDLEGNVIEGNGEPSSEIKLHLEVYDLRADVNAVCHAHPVYATAFSAVGRSFNSAVLPEIVGTLGGIPLVEYAPPGSEELARNLGRYLNRYDAFLLRSHGAVALGKTCEEAFNRLESVERFARILYIAERIGRPGLLSRAETIRLLEKAGRIDVLDEIIFGEE